MQDDYKVLIQDSVWFLKSLCRYYGTDRGMEIWEKFGEILGNEVKGAVFFGMLENSDANGDILRVRAGTCAQAVDAIKAIRNATGMGLIEAKNLWDASKLAPTTIPVNNPFVRRDLAVQLRNLGMEVD